MRRAGAELVREHARHPIHEHPHPRRQLPVLRIQHRHRHARAGVIAQHLDQPAFADVLLHAVQRQLDQAAAAQGRGDIAGGVVDRYPRVELVFAQSSLDGEFERITQIAIAGEEADRLMRRQLVGMARRAEVLQILGAGADHFRHRRQSLGHQRRIARHARAHHTVDAFAHQIDQAVAAADFQVDLRIAAAEFVDARQDDAGGVGAVQVQAQGAARIAGDRAQRRFGVVQFGQHVHAALVIGLPVQGRPHLPGGAVEQTRAQARFQFLDGMGGGGLGHVQHGGGAGEAAQLDDAGEQAQGLETVHGGLRGARLLAIIELYCQFAMVYPSPANAQTGPTAKPEATRLPRLPSNHPTA